MIQDLHKANVKDVKNSEEKENCEQSSLWLLKFKPLCWLLKQVYNTDQVSNHCKNTYLWTEIHFNHIVPVVVLDM